MGEPAAVAGRGGQKESFALRMDTFWSVLNARALSVSVAHDAFSFEISWLGVALVIGAMLLWRYLRRR